MELINEMEEIEKRKSKREKIQVIFLILLVVAVISMISAIIVVIKNAEMFTSNPIAFGVEQYGFDKCTCFVDNKFIEVNKDGFIVNEQEPLPNFEFKLGE